MYLQTEIASAKSHTHLQFSLAIIQTKIAKKY